jgi:hypothetical protein
LALAAAADDGDAAADEDDDEDGDKEEEEDKTDVAVAELVNSTAMASAAVEVPSSAAPEIIGSPGRTSWNVSSGVHSFNNSTNGKVGNGGVRQEGSAAGGSCDCNHADPRKMM